MESTTQKKRGRPLRSRTIDMTARQRILNAAKEVFAMAGFDGYTMSDIGQRSGMHNSMVAYYFSTKQLLWNAVVDQMNARSQRALGAMREWIMALKPPCRVGSRRR